jgi:hypothetical protein
MSYHRYINLYVGIDAVPGGGRKGGETRHAPYEEAETVARIVKEILTSAVRSDRRLSQYVIQEVTPTNAHPKPNKST